MDSHHRKIVATTALHRLLFPTLLVLSACASGSGSGGAGAPGHDGAPPLEELRAESRGRSTIGMEDVRIWHDAVAVQATLDASRQAVIQALPAVYASLGIPVAAFAPDEGVIVSPRWEAGRIAGQRPDRYFRCGSGNNLASDALAYAYQVTVRTGVRTKEGRTVLTTQARATAVERSVSGNSVRCATRQKLERAINGALRGALDLEP